jgi:hypothetical protein
MLGLCDEYRMSNGIHIGLASPADMPAVQRVAERDSRLVPAGDLLIAMDGGEVRAALSLSTGEVVADPFHPTAALVELLQIRARQRDGDRRGTWGRVGKLALRSAET